MLKKNVPTEDDWGDVSRDFDINEAYLYFSGKTNEDILKHLEKNALEIMELYRFMPEIPFHYYFLGFVCYIKSEKFSIIDASDITSYFLDITLDILRSKPNKILSIIGEVMPIVEYVAFNQNRYKAPVDIYGDYRVKLLKIKEIIEEL